MATIRILLGLFCLAIATGTRLPNSNLITDGSEKLLAIARSQLGVKEATNQNDGKQVEVYLKSVGLNKGYPWCAAFLSWTFKEAGFVRPRTAWCPALFPTARITRNIAPGLVFGIYSTEKKRIAHVGLVSGTKNDWVFTIEGNTNTSGGREGDGVYQKRRHKRTISAFANWLKD